jgi:ATP-dependent Clp protease ATP-binding subunit ClpX
MLNVMYEIPSRPDVHECVITKGVIDQHEEPLLVYEHEVDAPMKKQQPQSKYSA